MGQTQMVTTDPHQLRTSILQKYEQFIWRLSFSAFKQHLILFLSWSVLHPLLNGRGRDFRRRESLPKRAGQDPLQADEYVACHPSEAYSFAIR